MKSRLKTLFLSGVVALSSLAFSGQASAQALTPPKPIVGSTWTYDFYGIQQFMKLNDSFVKIMGPAGTTLQNLQILNSQMNKNIRWINVDIITIKDRLLPALIKNSTELNASIKKIDPNVTAIEGNTKALAGGVTTLNSSIDKLNVTISDIAGWTKETRDHFIGTAPATTGPSAIPMFNTPDFMILRTLNPEYEELYNNILNADLDKYPFMKAVIEKLVGRYNLQELILEKDSGTAQDIERENARTSLLVTALATGAIAERSFKKGNLGLLHTQEYIDALALSDSLKKSTDLNTRAVLELNETNSDILRVMSAYISMKVNEQIINTK